MRKNIFSILGCAALVIFSAFVCFGCSSSAETAEVTAAENQRLVNVMVMSIDGNNISVAEVEEAQESEAAEESGEGTAEESGESQSDEAQSQFSFDNANGEKGQMGGMRGSEGAEGGYPDMNRENMSTEEGETMFDRMNRPGMETNENGSYAGKGGYGMDGSDAVDGSYAGKGSFNNMMSVIEYQLPVSIVVHTATGTQTTFSRIAAGDTLQILLETNAAGEEVPVEIWMQ